MGINGGSEIGVLVIRSISYDRADWHSGGKFPQDLPPESGGTHIGMFLAWAIVNGLEGQLHQEDSPADLDAVCSRKMTGRDFLFKACDGKFWEEDLSEEGNRFARWYFAPEAGGYGPYIGDYEVSLTEKLPSIYHVADTWENFDSLAPVIARRFAEWKQKKY